MSDELMQYEKPAMRSARLTDLLDMVLDFPVVELPPMTEGEVVDRCDAMMADLRNFRDENGQRVNEESHDA